MTDQTSRMRMRMLIFGLRYELMSEGMLSHVVDHMYMHYFSGPGNIITKTSLFKYTENFTTKKLKIFR